MQSALKILLAAPRGFCAGVDRAILTVQAVLEKHGKPVYVRHEIVHNAAVVESLKAQGAIFVEELSDAPKDRPVIFSAHGVPKCVINEAEQRDLLYFDATCPLVTKVHSQADRYVKQGYHVVLIGHAGHPEVIGTMGQVEDGSMSLVQNVADVESLTFTKDDKLAYVTQTTLSIDDTAEIISALKLRFPEIIEPSGSDICYATSNRQLAVKKIATQADLLLVVGAENSSNSMRLVDVGKQAGCKQAYLIRSAADIDWSGFADVKTLALTAGASAPESLVQEVISACRERFSVDLEEVVTATEDLNFKLPPKLLNSVA